MRNSTAKKSLSLIAKEYRSTHGYSIAGLSSWSFGLTIFDESKELSRLALLESPNENQKGKYALRIVEHLIESGYLEYRVGRYYLTKTGFQQGSMSCFEVSLAFLNRNPGLLSFVAIGISLVALYFSVVSP